MTGQTQDFFHHYRAMDTRVLLARYRSDGLLPEAKAALLDVLADRGYTEEMLEGKGADAIRPPPVEVGVDARSVSINAGQLIKQKSVVSAFQASEPTGFRETWEAKIVRGCLLVVCAGAMCLASLFGMGMFVIANIFCDSGSLARCFSIGLDFLEVGVSADVLLILVIFALQSPKKWAAWYLKAVPVISLAVFVAAIHWYQTFPMFCTTPVVLSALIAVLSIAYLILSRKEPLGSR